MKLSLTLTIELEFISRVSNLLHTLFIDLQQKIH